MSGIFTCTPKESPGYEFRETLDFGRLHTSKRTWIRIPNELVLDQPLSAAFGLTKDDGDKVEVVKDTRIKTPSSIGSKNDGYRFREIESFSDGNAIVHSMAREYLGTDYDLLRKNCCTFARDVCLRLGVDDKEIPSWFHNAARVGADAEDALSNVETSMKHMFDCADGSEDVLDMDGYNHGFEVIVDLNEEGSTRLNVVESPPVYRRLQARQPLFYCEENDEDPLETLSWTY